MILSNATFKLARRTAGLTSEGAFTQLARARALEAAGRSVLHLEIGEPDGPSLPHVIEAGIRALKDGLTRYTEPTGLLALREAIAATHSAQGLSTNPDNIVVTPGAKAALFYAILSVVDPGAEVLVPDPGFPIYPSVVRFAGGVPVPYSLSGDLEVQAESLRQRITPRTRVLVLNAPHNPTGNAISSAGLVRIAEVVERHDLVVISDEIYARVWFGPEDRAPTIASIPGLCSRTIVVDGFSKTYGMTGWRLGYAILPRPWVGRFTALAVNAHSCTPGFVQHAGIAALQGPQSPVTTQVQEYRRRRDCAVEAFRAIPGVRCPAPSGAFYLFPDLSQVFARTGLSSEDFSVSLLRERNVAVLAGDAFGPGGAGNLRLSLVIPQAELEEALHRIRRFIQLKSTRD